MCVVNVSLKYGEVVRSFLHVLGVVPEEAICVCGWWWDCVVVLAEVGTFLGDEVAEFLSDCILDCLG